MGTIIFGTIGYKKYYPSISIADAYYYALQLLFMHAPHLEHTAPWQLSLARGLGMIAILTLIIVLLWEKIDMSVKILKSVNFVRKIEKLKMEKSKWKR